MSKWFVAILVTALLLSGCVQPELVQEGNSEMEIVEFTVNELELFRGKLKYSASALHELAESGSLDKASEEKVRQASKVGVLVKLVLWETHKSFDENKAVHIEALEKLPEGTGSDPLQSYHDDIQGQPKMKDYSSGERVKFTIDEVQLFRTRLKYSAKVLEQLAESLEGKESETVLQATKTYILVKWIFGETYKSLNENKDAHMLKLEQMPEDAGSDPSAVP